MGAANVRPLRFTERERTSRIRLPWRKGLLGQDRESGQPARWGRAIDWPTPASSRLGKPILKMPEKIPAKPFREKIVDAIGAEGGILNPGDSLQTVSDKMVALDTNILPVSEGGRLVGLADEPNPGL